MLGDAVSKRFQVLLSNVTSNQHMPCDDTNFDHGITLVLDKLAPNERFPGAARANQQGLHKHLSDVKKLEKPSSPNVPRCEAHLKPFDREYLLAFHELLVNNPGMVKSRYDPPMPSLSPVALSPASLSQLQNVVSSRTRRVALSGVMARSLRARNRPISPGSPWDIRGFGRTGRSLRNSDRAPIQRSAASPRSVAPHRDSATSILRRSEGSPYQDGLQASP
jgi:hypothetical protein